MEDVKPRSEKATFLFKAKNISLVFGIFFCFTLQAAERYEFYSGIRQMGMGGAAIAVVNDETALLLNPAALGKLRDYFITVVDPEITVSESFERTMGLSVQKSVDPQAILDKFNEGHFNQHLNAKGQMFPSLVFPNFGIGILGKYETNAEVVEETSEYLLDYTNDYAVVLGFNFRIWGGRIKLGANTRIINRVEIREALPANSTGLTVGSLADEGIGVASDLGIILTAPWAWLPTVSAVWRDVGNTSYTFSDGLFLKTPDERRPDNTEQTLDVALALFPITNNKVRWTWTAEYRDVLTTGEEDDQMRRLHTGLELNLGDALFVRAGMNQRYWTAGLEFALDNYQLQVASYGEEIGDVEKPREDRRYQFKFSYRF